MNKNISLLVSLFLLMVGSSSTIVAYTHTIEFGPTFMFMPGEYHLTFDLVWWSDINVDFKVKADGGDIIILNVSAKGGCDADTDGSNLIFANTVGWLCRGVTLTCKSLDASVPVRTLVGKSIKDTPGSNMARNQDYFFGVVPNLTEFTKARDQDQVISATLIPPSVVASPVPVAPAPAPATPPAVSQPVAAAPVTITPASSTVPNAPAVSQPAATAPGTPVTPKS